MYKKTGTSYFHITRTGSSATVPRLAPQQEDRGATGGGQDQLARSDGAYSIELQRQKLLAEKTLVDDKLGKIKACISQAKYQFRSSRVGVDPRLLHKWETSASDLGRRSQEIQREIGALGRLRTIENTLCFENEFIHAAREILHPDVFERIKAIAHDRAARTLATRDLANEALEIVGILPKRASI